MIGNQNYKYLQNLKTPHANVRAVAKVLGDQYGFIVKILLDTTRKDILMALSKLRKSMRKEDNLLIYYDGHGYFDRQSGTGYWQPVDADRDNDINWISMDNIITLLKSIRSERVLVVVDTSFPASLFVDDSGKLLPVIVDRNNWKKQSRVALTSGSMEPTMDSGGGDNSVFAKALLDVLRENQDILYASALFDRIKPLVKLSADQTPLYGGIPMAGHEMGDFFFVPEKIQKNSMLVRKEEIKPSRLLEFTR